jgi:hypothetical protein
MPRLKTKPSPVPAALIGWREKVSLPQIGIGSFIAKIDTGARTAALHATHIRVHGHRVDFTVPIKGRNHHCSLALKGEKRVKSSSGHAESRAVVETSVKLGTSSFMIEVTLTDRTDMGVVMLLGRASIRGRYVVHPGKSFIITPKKRKAK